MLFNAPSEGVGTDGTFTRWHRYDQHMGIGLHQAFRGFQTIFCCYKVDLVLSVLSYYLTLRMNSQCRDISACT